MNHESTNAYPHHGASRFRASQLIDGNITNAREQGLGSVQDIVLTSDNRTIAYVVIGFGGFLGMGEKFFAMPWRMIQVSRGDEAAKPRITLEVDQEVLKAAPGFDKNEWPDLASASWSRQVDDFYRTRTGNAVGTRTSSVIRPTVGAGRDPNRETFHFRRVSQLLGMEVVDANRETLAKVDDLVLDVDRATIDGVAVSFGGVMGMGKRIALVPTESLQLLRSDGKFGSRCTLADLEALALPGGEWPVLGNDEWLTRGRHQCDRVKLTSDGEASVAAWQE
jgi:sporulation protein YlmC with PRC-barrel domain